MSNLFHDLTLLELTDVAHDVMKGEIQLTEDEFVKLEGVVIERIRDVEKLEMIALRSGLLNPPWETC